MLKRKKRAQASLHELDVLASCREAVRAKRREVALANEALERAIRREREAEIALGLNDDKLSPEQKKNALAKEFAGRIARNIAMRRGGKKAAKTAAVVLGRRFLEAIEEYIMTRATEVFDANFWANDAEEHDATIRNLMREASSK